MNKQDQNKKKSRRLLWIIIEIIIIVLVMAVIVFFLLQSEIDSEDSETEIGLTWDCDCDNNVVVEKATRQPSPEGVVARIYMNVYEHYEVMTLDVNLTLTDGDTYYKRFITPVIDFPEGGVGMARANFTLPEGYDITAADITIHSCS